MLQETMEDLLMLEDLEKLMELTKHEVENEDHPSKNMLTTMRKLIQEKKHPSEHGATSEIYSNNPQNKESSPGTSKQNVARPVAGEEEVVDSNEAPTEVPLVFKFRKFLRDLRNSTKWEDLTQRSLCHRCRLPPDEPWVTSCLHLYCLECLNTMTAEAAQADEQGASCVECGNYYAESHPCDGIKELDANTSASSRESSQESNTRSNRQRRPRADRDADLKWIDFTGKVLPSAKTAAVQAQIEQWLKDDPDHKIIVFSQFHMLMRILGRICVQQNWGYVMVRFFSFLPQLRNMTDV